MNKTKVLSSIIVALALTLSPLVLVVPAAASTSGDFYYLPQSVVLGATDPASGSTPLCSSVSVVSIVCYAPNFVRTAYNYPAGLDGTGQTIIIVDAFGSPTIASDLATFDSTFGIAAPPSFTILCGTGGCPTFNPRDFAHDEAGWAIETSLDVEYAHAMAPGANIVLDVASTSSGNSINNAEEAAISAYPGSVLSQSFGIPEYLVSGNNAQILQADANYVAAKAAGITVLASAGDNGATNGISTANALFPSSNPFNLAVGGTEGNPYVAVGTLEDCGDGETCSTGLSVFTGPCTIGPRPGYPGCTPIGYGGEQVWNENFCGLFGCTIAATGGAPSLLFSKPSYQVGITPTSARTTPDVSYNAAVDGGVLVFSSALVSTGHWYIVGGTSAGSPQWAAIFAIVNQQRTLDGKGPIGFVNSIIYGFTAAKLVSDFHDITVGNNQLAGTPVGFSAGPGYDLASGFGTPNVSNLVSDLG